MALKHTKVSAAGASPDPAKVGGDDWNAEHVADSGGLLMATAASPPSAPAAGNLKALATDFAGRGMLGWLGADGAARTPVQPFLGRNKFSLWMPVGDLGNTINIGLSITSFATTALRTTSPASLFAMARRLGYTAGGGVASAGSSAGFRSNAVQFARGSVAGTGGFTNVWRFGVSDPATVSDSRMFCGLVGTTAIIGNVNPSTVPNLVGIGVDSGETTLSIISNDASGNANKTALGANFPAQTLSTDLYELALYCAPCGSVVKYRVERLNTGDVATGTLSTKLPAASTLLAPQIWRNNGSLDLAIAIDVVSMYIETDL
jgi:hypothetical protein